MWKFKDEKDFLEFNKSLHPNKPVIGYCPDWRVKDHEAETKEFHYMEALINQMRRFIDKCGGQLYIIDYSLSVKEIEKKIDGLLIPGGRDINPKFYNQEDSGSIIEPDSLNRFPFMKKLYLELDPRIPVFGICWGFQFINVVHGGDMIQHIENSEKHYNQRRMHIRNNCWFQDVIGHSMIGQCYHHQGLGKIGKDIEITIVDDFSNEPHALEVVNQNRWVKAVLWHPEATFQDEVGDHLEEDNIKLLQGFVNVCKETQVKRQREQLHQ